MRYLAKAAPEDRRPRAWGVPGRGTAERGGAPAFPGQPHRRCIPSAGPSMGPAVVSEAHHRDRGGGLGLGAVTCSQTCTAPLSETTPQAGQRSMNGNEPGGCASHCSRGVAVSQCGHRASGIPATLDRPSVAVQGPAQRRQPRRSQWPVAVWPRLQPPAATCKCLSQDRALRPNRGARIRTRAPGSHGLTLEVAA
jgi:hypothetical protein